MSGAGSHQHHLVLRTDDAVDDSNERDDAHVVVKPAVDDERLQRSIFVAFGRRHVAHDALENIVDAHAGLGRAFHRVGGINADDVLDFFLGGVGIGACQVHLVENRHDFNTQIDSRIAVGHRLCFHALSGVDHQKSSFAGRQRAAHLIGEVDVPRSVDQIEFVNLTVLGLVLKTGRLSLNRDAAFALEIHAVEHLFAHLSIAQTTATLNQTVSQRRLAMVDMGNDGKITDIVH